VDEDLRVEMKFGRGAFDVSITTENFLPRWEGRFIEKWYTLHLLRTLAHEVINKFVFIFRLCFLNCVYVLLSMGGWG
jgi:hypothetical protein